MNAEDRDDEFVVGLLFDPARQRVVLIRKEKPEWQKGRWNGPGGHVRRGESPEEAVEREVEEETGVVVKGWQLIATLSIPLDDNGRRGQLHYLTATIEQPASHVSSQTNEVVDVFPVNQLPHRLMPKLRWFIPLGAYAEEQRGLPLQIIESWWRAPFARCPFEYAHTEKD